MMFTLKTTYRILAVLILSCTFTFVKAGSVVETYTSSGSGNWNNGGIWTGGTETATPEAEDHVVIVNTNTITVNNNYNITNVTINVGGKIIHDNNKRLTVSGNYNCNGTHDANNTFVDLTGSGTTIDGSGTIVVKQGKFSLITGNKTVASSANLTFTNGNVSMDGITITNNGTVYFSEGLDATNAAASWVNAANSTLKMGKPLFSTMGSLTASATGNTVEFAQSGAQTVVSPVSSTYHNLKISGTGIKSPVATLTLNGNLVISSGTFDILTNDIVIKGNITNSGTFTVNSQLVSLDGGSDKTISNSAAFTFFNLSVNNSGGTVSISDANIIVSNTLTMTAGNISTGSKKITVGTSTVNVGTLSHTAGTVIGTLEKWVNATGAYTFPVGTAASYRPITLTINTLASSGSLTAGFTASNPGKTGFNLDDSGTTLYNPFNEGYWTLTEANGGDVTAFNLDLEAAAFSSFTFDADARIITRVNSGASWTVEGTHVAAVGTTAKRTGLSTMSGEYAIGDDTNCTGPSTSAITGNSTVCAELTTDPYSVVNTVGSTYEWIITGGTQASGGTNNSITVDWGGVGMIGKVQVIETNTCTSGDTVSQTVNLEALPSGTITGKSNIAENTNGEAYSITNRAGYSYTWSIPSGNGTIQTGQGTNAITIDWGTASSAQVCVDATKGGCTTAADQECVNVNVYVVINSLGTGNWENTGTWDCACVPGSSESVKIKATHTVTITGNATTIQNLTVDASGTLNLAAKDLTVTNDLTVDGLISGTATNKNFTINGSTTSIDGVGQISCSQPFILSGGNKEILNSASLNRSPGNIDIQGGIIVTNKGIVLVAGNLTGNNASSKWINSDNSAFTVGGTVFAANGILTATSSGNTVTYNGSGTQTIYQTNYYNISTGGTSVTTIPVGGTTISGDVNIAAGTTFDLAGETANVSGNWTNSGGTFTHGNGTIVFNGTSTQTVTNAGGETFFNLTVNSGSNVNIVSSTTVTVSNTFSNSGTVDSDGNLTLPNGYSGNSGTLRGDGTITVSGGNWDVGSGTFTGDNGTVLFNGGAAQTIAGTATFNDLTINNASGVSVSSGTQNITGSLTLTSGAFATNNALTLISNASGTGRIAEITGGSISGNITQQRHLPAGKTGYRQVSSAVSGVTLADWNDDYIMSGFTGSNSPSFNNSVFSYDETPAGDLNTGWVGATNITNSIGVGQGFMNYIGNGSVNSTAMDVDNTGPANNGTVGIPVSWTNTGAPADDGWNLVGNPFPSTIDWDGAGWTKTNLDNAVYIWDPQNSQYASYVGGVGSNGGSRYIPSSQAFWVQAVGAGPVLQVTEPSKDATDQLYFRQADDVNHVIRFKFEGNGYNDETVIRFDDSASYNYDASLDAKKLGYWTNISTVYDTNEFSINSLPSIVSQDHTVNIRVYNISTATHTIKTDIGDDFPLSSCLVMEDLATGTFLDLRTDTLYSFMLVDTTTAPRFKLHTTSPLGKETKSPLCFNGNDGMAIATGKGIGPWDYTWKDESGNVLKSTSGVSSADTLSNLASGIYYVEVTNPGGFCSLLTDSFNVLNPEKIIASQNISHVTCNAENDGSLIVATSDDPLLYDFLWSNGGTSNTTTGLIAGIYEVSVTNQVGCLEIKSYSISEPLPLTLNKSLSHPGCFESCTGSADIIPMGGNTGFTAVWSNGRQQLTESGLCDGIYALTITDSKGCEVVDSFVMIAPDEIVVDTSFSLPSCGSADGVISASVIGGTTPFTYLWNDLNYQTTSSASNLRSGVYQLTVTDANNCKAIQEYELQDDGMMQIDVSGVPAGCISVLGEAQVELNDPTGYSFQWDDYQMQTSVRATGLDPSTYFVSITDPNGCTSVERVDILETDQQITADIINSVQPSCFGFCDGEIALGITGGSGLVDIIWDDGSNQLIKTGLCNGTYSAFVIDSLGCRDTITASITEPADIIDYQITSSDVSCFGYNDGEIHINQTISTYSVLWSDGNVGHDLTAISPGVYSTTITDMNGCIEYDQVTINSPVDIDYTHVISSVSCQGFSDGEITITPGAATLSVSWDNGVNGNTLSSIPIGFYTATITDVNTACFISETYEVIEPNNILEYGQIQDVSCYGAFDGSVAVTVSDPNAGVIWNTGDTDALIENLDDGIYEVTVTLGNCSETQSYVVFEPEEFVISMSTLDASCSGLNDGEIDVMVLSGGNYFYNWSGGQTTSSVSGLNAGNYVVTISNNFQCVKLVTATVSEPAPVISSFDSQADSVTVSAGTVVFDNNSQNAFSYTWDFGDGYNSFDVEPIHDYFLEGDFYVTLVASNGNCSDTSGMYIYVINDALSVSTINEFTNLSLIDMKDSWIIKGFDTDDYAASYSFYNGLGQILNTGLIGNRSQVSIHKNNLSSGVYFVQISGLAGDHSDVTIKILRD